MFLKTRVISALVGLVILAVVLLFLDTLLLNIVMGAISIMAVLELLNATKIIRRRSLLCLSLLMALTIPFARAGYVSIYLIEIVFVIILAYFILLLRNHSSMRLQEVAMAFFFSTFVPAFFSCAVYLRDDYGMLSGRFYLLLALGSAWLADTGAYFVGVRFGRHKLAPVVSPKKTVEGSVGGIVVGILFMQLIAWGYSGVCAMAGSPVVIRYPQLLLVTAVTCAIGMLGDLSASVIKRSFGVKDFGHIMPGHGGVMDRFDSVLFTLPTVYILGHHITLIFVSK